ncbi:uncharacterized protein BYT42DRAFT_559631 [Radiomyces spectabilis]|uniref:uncharacterized protein n=1 Tax=Radiomyces spectabilis TaxID=64574 RepID=UPI00221F6741|nr:uncharacterized protein BYT42DRAFT_559631 [Radiomyces spectabilis]KAI8388302.1 hypothetical protein BYT42DRAFT_559631 [Radiomyces spectabilis]
MYNGETFLKLRYATDPEAETFFQWEGTVFAFIPGQPPKRVFECVGMNVARATVEDGKLYVTSRELTYFLDPTTHEKLDEWVNPWTNETLPVIHIANDPVQMALPIGIPLNARSNAASNTTAVAVEIPLFYPNPLATEEGKFDAYDGNKMYQAGEFFTFRCATSDLEKPDTIDKVDLDWTRICGFAPFMKMGKTNGYLIFHCTGYKLPQNSTYEQLHPVLRKEIQDRLSEYAHAPCKYDAAVKSVSSWSYFRQHYDRYVNDPKTVWPVSQAE